ncbi:MAG: hypothetical protein DRO23_04330 [Thermoprotei archaeon]|nr:MAG: hypothetical protein DRO23_04330 [Thermoprotei archaeon]
MINKVYTLTRNVKYISLFFLSLFLLICIVTCTVKCQTVGVEVLIEVYSDGLAKVTYIVKAANPPQDLTLPLFASPMYVEAFAEETPLTVEYNETHVFLTALSKEVKITYYTSGLTEKTGEEWCFEVNSPWTVTVMLPENALIFDMKPEDFELVLINDKPGFIFKQGNVLIKYIITPEITTPKPALTPTPEQPYISPTFIAIAVFTVTALLLAILYIRRRRKPRSIVELDERDNKILTVLSKHGEMTAYELIDKTGIPKTPLYRRLKRLEKLGYIESVVKAGRTIYRLKTKKK